VFRKVDLGLFLDNAVGTFHFIWHLATPFTTDR
jgi:hypothetical protein